MTPVNHPLGFLYRNPLPVHSQNPGSLPPIAPARFRSRQGTGPSSRCAGEEIAKSLSLSRPKVGNSRLRNLSSNWRVGGELCFEPCIQLLQFISSKASGTQMVFLSARPPHPGACRDSSARTPGSQFMASGQKSTIPAGKHLSPRQLPPKPDFTHAQQLLFR